MGDIFVLILFFELWDGYFMIIFRKYEFRVVIGFILGVDHGGFWGGLFGRWFKGGFGEERFSFMVLR